MGNRFEEVREKMDRFMFDWPGSEFGPAHIILGDDNLDDYWIDEIIRQIETGEFVNGRYEPGDPSIPDAVELRATVAFLRSLKDIPEEERCPDRGSS